MNYSFLSIVSILNVKEDIDKAEKSLHNIYQILKDNFSDFEIILVNNTLDSSINSIIETLDENFKKDIFLINLSKQIDENNAIVAGLDQANGDYVVLLETDFYNAPELIVNLYHKTQENFDIIYLRSQKRVRSFFRQILLNVFYFILKRYSSLTLDEKAYNSRIISRRALNSILKLRENLRYMKAIYSLVGYRTSFIELNSPLKKKHASLSEELKTSIIAITSFTDFLRVLLMWIFIFSIIFFLGVTSNALLVKFLGKDILGNPQAEVTGWSFLVILISLTFAILCLILYIMSIYLSNIYSEIKQRPLYIIESIKRF